MKAVILAGGLGSRLSEETHNKPKRKNQRPPKFLLQKTIRLRNKKQSNTHTKFNIIITN